MAEREGFEPSVRLPAQRFSRPPRSTTPAPLRKARLSRSGRNIAMARAKNKKKLAGHAGTRQGRSKRALPARLHLPPSGGLAGPRSKGCPGPPPGGDAPGRPQSPRPLLGIQCAVFLDSRAAIPIVPPDQARPFWSRPLFLENSGDSRPVP